MNKAWFAAFACLCWSGLASAQLYFLRDDTGQLYSVSTATGAATLVGTVTAVTSDTIGLTESPNPGVLYGSTYQNLVSFNLTGGAATVIGALPHGGAEGLAWCIPANVLYGIINGAFYSINPATGGLVADLASPGPGADAEGLACDHPHNVVYGLAGDGGPMGNLYRYTPSSNTWVLVGNTGILFDLNGLAMDTNAGLLYAMGSQDGNLYRINPQTAATTVVGPTGLGPGVGGGMGFIYNANPVNVSIPTLSTWTLAVLALFLAAGSMLVLRRRT
jgi:hypothetical protein